MVERRPANAPRAAQRAANGHAAAHSCVTGPARYPERLECPGAALSARVPVDLGGVSGGGVCISSTSACGVEICTAPPYHTSCTPCASVEDSAPHDPQDSSSVSVPKVPHPRGVRYLEAISLLLLKCCSLKLLLSAQWVCP